MPAKEIEHSKLKEQIPHLQLFKSRFESTNTLIEDGVRRNLYNNFFQLSAENIRQLDFNNTYFENHFQNFEFKGRAWQCSKSPSGEGVSDCRRPSKAVRPNTEAENERFTAHTQKEN
ncbi:hypothetical protein TNCV_33851 [Trichonephila clavipes]|nr:hypothetical protein TNCV_33851 [Trichonephila clavipes]